MRTISRSESGWNVDTPPRVVEEAVVSIPDSVADALWHDHPSSEVQRWADGVARALDELPFGIALRLGEHTADASNARVLAHRLALALRDALVRRGAPDAMAIEIDAEQSSEVAADRQHRTLLPHHDGGNASFLTPSVLDDPMSGPHRRRTSPQSVTTTRRHKMYQGFFLREVGDCHSITTYYDLLSILHAAYRHQTGVEFAKSVADVAQWTGANLRRALALIDLRGGTYVTLGSMLGSTNPMHCLIPVHQAEARFTREQIDRYPELQVLNASGEASFSPSERLFDQVLQEAAGEGWMSIRERYEVGVRGVPNDFLLGHNLTLLHGGWRGGRGRVIEPICFTLESPSGGAYEKWLWQAWRRRHRLGSANAM